MRQKTSSAFVTASWLAMGTGLVGYLIGLWRADMVVSLQKSVRDKLEGMRVTDIYYNICWFGTILSIVLLVVGLWNATILPSEKGYYAFAFILSMFGAIAIQKNTRDDMVATE